MEAAVERVIQTYGMLVSLTSAQEREARERVSSYLRDKGEDEHKLAVEGLKHLLGHSANAGDVQSHLRTALSSCWGG